MVKSAADVATRGNKRMDADSQVRPVLDRMAVDFSQMIRRSDVDYDVKGPLDLQEGAGVGANDRIAFFSNVTGYYPTPTYHSPISLVSYRIYTPSPPPSPCPNCNRMERMGKGLVWSGVSTGYKPVFFGLQAIVNNWPEATTNTAIDPDYELVGPQIFRFEYFYLLKTGAISNLPGADGMQDVAAISVVVAAIDQKSRTLLLDSQLTTLSERLKDFDKTQAIYDLTTSWQTTLNGVTDMPRVAINGVRIYQRYLYSTSSQ